MTLKVAFGGSAILHLSLLALRPPAGWVPPKEALHTLVVTYEPVRLPERASAPAPARQSISGGSVQPAAAPRRLPAPRARQAGVAAPPPAPAAPDPLSRGGHEQIRVPSPALPKTQAASTAPNPQSIRGGVSLPEGPFAAVQHKLQVKEHLKACLKYPLSRLTGRVRLQVWLDRQGVLRHARVLEASDPRLAQAALQDARSAAPYPAFPRSLKGSQARYEFLVKYEPE